jgi:hypothetical protein
MVRIAAYAGKATKAMRAVAALNILFIFDNPFDFKVK